MADAEPLPDGDDAARRLRELVERFTAGDRAAVTTAGAARLAEAAAADLRSGQRVDVRRLQVLGHFHLARFQALDQEPDLQRAMTFYAQLYPVRPDLVPASLHDLIEENADGTRLLRRAIEDDDPAVLDGAIEVLTAEAAAADPPRLSNLSTALIRRFLQAGDADDLDGAIRAFDRAARLAGGDDPQRAHYLAGLASALRERGVLADDAGDLDAAVSAGRAAVAGADGDLSMMAGQNLGNALVERFRRAGAGADVEEALLALRAVAALLSADDPRLLSVRNSAAVALRARYDRSGVPADLAAAHDLLQDIEELPGDPRSRTNAWNTRGTNGIARFEAYGRLPDLDTAIKDLQKARGYAREAGSLPDVLMNLGNAHLVRFEHLDDETDLAAAVDALTEAERLAPSADRLSNLALALSARFEHAGDRTDLDAAVALGQRAVEVSDGHVERAAMLGNLGNLLAVRADHSATMLDLDAARVVLEEAARTVPGSHPDAARHRNNLGLAWRARFERTGEPGDLDAALREHEAAVATVRPGSPERSGYVSNLGVARLARYTADGDPADLDAAVAAFEAGLAALPDGARDTLSMSGNLGTALTERARRTAGVADRDRAVDLLRQASAGGPDQARASFYLATALLGPHKPGPGYFEAMSALARAAGAGSAAPSLRLAAASTAGHAARAAGDPSVAVDAFRVALSLLPLLSGRRLRRADQEFHLAERAGLAGAAAEASIRADRPADAVELLEQGRAVLWSQRIAVRGATARLDPRAARRLAELRELLDVDSLRPTTFGSRGGPVAGVLRELRADVRRERLLREMHALLADPPPAGEPQPR
ncbi:hypothetical protein [Dactylosporangium sp. NPDC051541]|uniref:hypothetical protein n=1 Tax=Dactylosporangium sp. NPDC051541 TaxID=3363977 RepID=UPI003788D762